AIFKPPKAIRGGIPVLFPQIEAHPLPVPSSHHSSSALVDLILRSSSQDDLKIWPHKLYLNTPNKIVVHKEGQIDAVVWNPWEKKVSDLGVEDYSRFVAVESAAVHKILQMSEVTSS
ncbi:hypothetical protein F2Q68_00040402, partial [Brassica cretica]